ncbi:hypothetical protein EV144_1011219 [Flavobacterium sp. 270]|uniref:hypothetical protein n=1 Tax=Flavobacterium sp. 270 TaxID=2512114 RepID=UPI001064DCF3|nr:hypothetical protein [Flavobacterium sp. 270]TDW52528.1 hypothetical protein EV144_1011219 [Flavobacterium sp. 270]
MKSIFLENNINSEILFTQNLSSQNGNDCEVISAANLVQAFSGEVRWGSRNEDNSKIDLLLSFDHPWNSGQRTFLLTQVKSGKSYGKANTKFIKIYKRGIREVKESLNNICLIWYDHVTKENYWAYIHYNTISKKAELGKNHILTPATKFEIARCINKNIAFNKFNSRGLILNFKNNLLNNISEYRKYTKQLYRKNKKVLNPLFGNIEFTNYGWKHMFRKSRLKNYKKDSLTIIPYLKQLLLLQPDRHWIISFKKHKHKENFIHFYEHILRYENIKNNLNDDKYEIVIKLIEEIAYPIEWKKENVLSQKISRKVVFKSCSLKKA